jgi:8-oxo-dGTP diphosphatase
MGKSTRRNLSSKQMESHPVEGCGALVYCTSTGRFLFLLRPADRRHAKSWGLVGGKIEAGETTMQGLIREIWEETGFDASGHKIIPIEKFTSTDSEFVYHTFMMPIEKEFCPELNHEHTGYCWTPLEDYPKPLHPGVWRSFSFGAVVDKIQTMQTVLKGQLPTQTL